MSGPAHKRSAPWPPQDPSQISPKRLCSPKSPSTDPLSRFEKQKVLGHGTFGVVWAAREKTTNKSVALKQIKMEGKEGFPRTALREIRIMSKHKHQNILSLKEVVWADKADRVEAYIVMDLYDFDLRKVLDRIGVRFTPPEVKFLLLQLVNGVKYLHGAGLMHRDLKTENYLKGNLKICDFGLSRACGEKVHYTPVVVTLWYRPPELLLGPVDYEREIDQWSVGCIFAEIVRGTILFKGEKETDQIDKIFRILGTPNNITWPGFSSLAESKNLRLNNYSKCLRTVFQNTVLTDAGIDLLETLLAYNPDDRLSSRETLDHEYFRELPAPVTSIAIASKPEFVRYRQKRETAHQQLTQQQQQQAQAQQQAQQQALQAQHLQYSYPSMYPPQGQPPYPYSYPYPPPPDSNQPPPYNAPPMQMPYYQPTQQQGQPTDPAFKAQFPPNPSYPPGPPYPPPTSSNQLPPYNAQSRPPPNQFPPGAYPPNFPGPPGLSGHHGLPGPPGPPQYSTYNAYENQEPYSASRQYPIQSAQHHQTGNGNGNGYNSRSNASQSKQRTGLR